MGKNMSEVTDQNFDSTVLQSSQTFLVDFWAPWCGPCKAIAPAIDALAEAYEGRMRVGKCNVDDNPDIPKRYGIRSVPTVVLFKGGRVFEQMTGMISRAKLENAIQNALKGGAASSPFVVQ